MGYVGMHAEKHGKLRDYYSSDLLNTEDKVLEDKTGIVVRILPDSG